MGRCNRHGDTTEVGILQIFQNFQGRRDAADVVADEMVLAGCTERVKLGTGAVIVPRA